MPETKTLPANLDAIIVGAGFGGLYMLHRLRGLGLSARILEAADGVGGSRATAARRRTHARARLIPRPTRHQRPRDGG